jgi:DNA mismatch endonuclease, patch repair protein
MPDIYPPEVRSRVMASVRGRDTRPEIRLRRALYAAGVRGWRCHDARLPGKPDVSFGRARLAVFVDGGFWHGHPSRFRPGRSGTYWDAKIARNQERDREVDEALLDRGWRVIRVWDFEVEADAAKTAARVISALDEPTARKSGTGESAG